MNSSKRRSTRSKRRTKSRRRRSIRRNKEDQRLDQDVYQGLHRSSVHRIVCLYD